MGGGRGQSGVIEVCATSEAINQHGTTFDYGASKGAFNRWVGNTLDIHDKRAAGSRVAVRYYVRWHVSKRAQDTWEKVLDGTLKGASIGACNMVWQQQRRDTRTVPVGAYYDLAELSLVDNPSNTDGLGIEIVRSLVRAAPAAPVFATPAASAASLGNPSAGIPQAAAILERDGSPSPRA